MKRIGPWLLAIVIFGASCRPMHDDSSADDVNVRLDQVRQIVRERYMARRALYGPPPGKVSITIVGPMSICDLEQQLWEEIPFERLGVETVEVEWARDMTGFRKHYEEGDECYHYVVFESIGQDDNAFILVRGNEIVETFRIRG